MPVRQLRKRVRAGATVAALALSVVAGACGATQTAAQQRAAIDRAYATLFNFADHSVTAKVAVIQNGRSLRAALTAALSSSLASKATGARVTAVRVLSAGGCSDAALPSPCARVTYDLLGPSGQPLFATPSAGYAVEVNGRWLVAKATICGLLELFYTTSGRSGTPPGC